MKLIKFLLPTFFLALLLSFCSAAMAAQALRLAPEKESYMLGGYMEVFEDTSGTLEHRRYCVQRGCKEIQAGKRKLLNLWIRGFGFLDTS